MSADQQATGIVYGATQRHQISAAERSETRVIILTYPYLLGFFERYKSLQISAII
jgi:hypothetical protein